MTQPDGPMTRLTTLSRSVVGTRVLVTGAGSGMGRATAHLFADEGAVVAVADINPDAVESVVGEIVQVHGAGVAFGFVCDVGDRAAVCELPGRVADALSGIDVLVNNAGVSLLNSVFQDDATYELNWARSLDINVTAQSRLIRSCHTYLLAAPRGGRVVNIASTEAIVTTAGLAAYAASKAAVVGLTRSFAVEMGRYGVTVNCICPGPIDTGMTASIDAQSKDAYARRRVPVRRYGNPEEVAHITLSLCLPAASYVNGAVIPVDGGMSIRHT